MTKGPALLVGKHLENFIYSLNCLLIDFVGHYGPSID